MVGESGAETVAATCATSVGMAFRVKIIKVLTLAVLV